MKNPLSVTSLTALAALSLAGCRSTGTETAALALTPIPSGKARVTISRPSTLLYAGCPATITLGGLKVADVATGGKAVVDIPAGEAVLAASCWSYSGQFSVKLKAAAGQNYALEVAPRSGSFGPSLLGPIGAALEASVTENAGAFEMKVVPAPGAVASTAKGT